ncbi:RidA family protein [Caldivirga sp. UBA161]|uniref:RidA family protein n=1 Tax=Caldivirga sp. UBA161 TaxID=1915569 RepID=UPI0025C256D5|nr:RidA family protein [Caldivirga sp. UBA161]
MIRGINVEGLPKAGPYSHAVIANGLVFVSGQLGTVPGRDLSFEDQFRNAVGKISKILTEAGSSLDNVIKVTVYLADAKYFDTMNKLFSEYFTSKPARTTVVTSMIDPRALIEIDVVAVVKS